MRVKKGISSWGNCSFWFMEVGMVEFLSDWFKNFIG
jgi:hypothetical protein